MPRTTTLELAAPPDERVPEDGSILFIGTATTLIRAGGFTILTDPNFLHAGDHAHLGYGMRSRRLTDPALDVEELPPLDACVLSHFHGDHWDEVATERLPKQLPVLTPHEAARALHRRGFARAQGLATWDAVVLRRGRAWLRVTALPGRHGPPVVAALLPDVMGSMLELGVGTGAPRFRIYVSGDTLVHEDLRRIPERFPGVDVGLFHLGGTRILGVLVTMDAEQGVEAVRIVNPDAAVPIHYDDYPVFESPLEDFLRAAERAGLAAKVHPLARGERYAFTLRPALPPLQEPAGPRVMGPAASPRASGPGAAGDRT